MLETFGVRTRLRPPARRAPYTLVLALLASLGGSCGRCGRCGPGASGAGPERYVPRDAPAVVVVPELRRAVREAAALHRAAGAFPGTAEVAAWRDAVAAQLGLDPLDPEALEANGLDADRGAAVAWLLPGPGAAARDGTQLLVLPVADAGKVEALLGRLARERLGAGVRTEEDGAGRTVVTFRPAPGAPASLAFSLANGTALVVPGAGGAEAVAAAAARAHEASLAGSAAYDRARRVLGEDRAVIFWIPPDSPAVPREWPLRGGVAAGLTGSEARVRTVLAALLGDREPGVRSLAASGNEGAAFAKRLDPRAAIVLRFDGDPATLGRLALPYLPARERVRFAALGLDLQRDLFDQALPGAAGAIRLNPGLRVPALTEAAFRADPLRALQFEAVVRLRDPAAAQAVSARLARGGPPWRIASAAGEFAWRIDGDRLAIVGGEAGDLDRLVARLDGGGGGGYRPRSEAAGDALEDGLGGLVVDPANLVAQARALPASAFGTGPSGFVLRSVIERVLEPASRLTAISARAELVEGTLRVALEVEAPASQAAR
jgi:hypothetical protein